MFENLGKDAVTGAVHAAGGLLGAVPLTVWLSLFGGLIVFGVAIRYLTNIKVDIALAVIFVIITSAFAWRAHFIEEGYLKAQAEVKAAQLKMLGYQNTEKLIIACYAADSVRLDYIWDRTDGKCKRVDGG